jgi:deazaflavin-dependent oxidoreductase (nitroreductase family)
MTAPADPPYVAPDLTFVGDSHIALYESTDGREGYFWNGVPTLLLTTTGRRSGEPRKIAIIYNEVDDKIVLIASMGGAPKHPAWYLNLVANPQVEVQIRGEKFSAVARVTESPEREELWRLSAAEWPNYDVYVTRTDRQIPVVVLTRTP